MVPELLTLDEVARALRVSRRMVESFVSARELSSLQLGTRRLVSPRQLEEFIRRCELEADSGEAPALAATPVQAPPARPAMVLPPARVNFEEHVRERIAARRTGTSGGRSTSTGRSRGTRRSTSSAPPSPSSDGGPSSRNDT